jgi:hypothetical protein
MIRVELARGWFCDAYEIRLWEQAQQFMEIVGREIISSVASGLFHHSLAVFVSVGIVPANGCEG